VIDLTILQLAFASLGMAGAGGVCVKLYARWQDSIRDRRKQSDDAVSSTNQMLMARLDAVERKAEANEVRLQLEAQVCDAKLDNVHHELRNFVAAIDGFVWAASYAPPERRDELIKDLKQRLDEVRVKFVAPAPVPTRGDLNNGDQRMMSAVRVAVDEVVGGVRSGGDAVAGSG
jgi:hypothetical protein